MLLLTLFFDLYDILAIWICTKRQSSTWYASSTQMASELHVKLKFNVVMSRTDCPLPENPPCVYSVNICTFFNIHLWSNNNSPWSRRIFPLKVFFFLLGSSNLCIVNNACACCTCSAPLWKRGHDTAKKLRVEECSGHSVAPRALPH